MALLFNRQFELNLGGTLIASSQPSESGSHDSLRIAFKIEKDLTKTPNNAEIQIWNLSPKTRAKLSEAQLLPTRLKVGHGNILFQIYSGDLYHASSQRTGADWITKISCKDGGAKTQDARVNESVAPKSPISDLLMKVGKATGLGLGNLASNLTNHRSGVNTLPVGASIQGNAIDEFAKLMKYTGNNWSVQDGQIQVLIPGKSLPVTSELINVNTGMIGAPELGDKGQTKFKAIIRPNLFPGYPVSIESNSGIKTGSFLIIHSEFTGDTHGQDWQVECECFPLGAKSRAVPIVSDTAVN